MLKHIDLPEKNPDNCYIGFESIYSEQLIKVEGIDDAQTFFRFVLTKEKAKEIILELNGLLFDLNE